MVALTPASTLYNAELESPTEVDNNVPVDVAPTYEIDDLALIDPLEYERVINGEE